MRSSNDLWQKIMGKRSRTGNKKKNEQREKKVLVDDLNEKNVVCGPQKNDLLSVSPLPTTDCSVYLRRTKGE